MLARRNMLLAFGTVVAVTVSYMGAAPAMATEDPISSLESVSQASPAEADVLSDAATVSPTGDVGEVGVASAAGVDTSFPTDATDPITLSGSTGETASLEIGLPFAADASPAEVDESGAVSYNNGNGSTSVAVASSDGSLVVATVISDASAPTRYDYEYTLPAGGSLVPSETGGVLVLDGSGVPLAMVDAPWAYDANGNAVPTHYEINGSVLTQTVDHDGAAYPVVADPRATFFWWGQGIKFTKAETARVANATSNAEALSILCGLIASAPGAVACGIAGFVGASLWLGPFRTARGQGKCVQLNMVYLSGPLLWNPYIVTC